MKSILYVAAALMISASIYGFVNYSKTSKHKEFRTMYEEPKIKEPAPAEEKKQTNILAPETDGKKEIAEVKKEEPAKKPAPKMKKERTIGLKSFSRAPLREKEEVIILPEEKETKEKEQ